MYPTILRSTMVVRQNGRGEPWHVVSFQLQHRDRTAVAIVVAQLLSHWLVRWFRRLPHYDRALDVLVYSFAEILVTGSLDPRCTFQPLPSRDVLSRVNPLVRSMSVR